MTVKFRKALYGLLLLSGLAAARKAEPARSKALLQARQTLVDRTDLSDAVIKEVPPSAFQPPAPYSWHNNCDEARVALERAVVRAPTLDPLDLLAKAQVDMERVEVQMMMANQSDGRGIGLLDRLFEIRGKELARASQEPLQLNLFNPSVLPLPEAWRQSPDEKWMAAFRHQEVSSLNAYWCVPRAVASVIVLAVLDSDLRLTRPVRVITHRDLFNTDFECVDMASPTTSFGPEDPRLLWHPTKEKMLVLFNSKARTTTPLKTCPKTMVRMHAAELASDLTVSRSFEIALDSEVQGQKPRIGKKRLGAVEKNWSPFLHRTVNGAVQVLLEQSVDPHVVLDFDVESGVAANVVWNSSQDLSRNLRVSGNFSHVHGGVGPILVNTTVEGIDLEPPFYLSILHAETRRGQHDVRKTGWVYRSYFFAFASTPPFNILRVGHSEIPLARVPTVYSTLVAFPTQMLLSSPSPSPDPDVSRVDELLVFYGSGDLESHLLRVPLANLSAYL